MALKKVVTTTRDAKPAPAPAKSVARAEQCVICKKEYTLRKMGTGNPYVGKPVCTACLPKALAEEKTLKEGKYPLTYSR